MTSEQINAIEEIDISQESMQIIQDALGIDMAAGRCYIRKGGGFGPGGPGGQMPNVEDMSEQDTATLQAQRGGGALGGAGFLIEPLIELLETRAAE